MSLSHRTVTPLVGTTSTTHTPTGAPNLAIVLLANREGAVTVTYGGVAMTPLANEAAYARHARVFALANPPVGAQTVALSDASAGRVAWCVTYAGADVAGTAVTVRVAQSREDIPSSYSEAVTSDVTSELLGLLHMHTSFGAPTRGSEQTALSGAPYSNADSIGADAWHAPGGTTPVTGSFAGGTDEIMAFVVVEVHAAAGPVLVPGTIAATVYDATTWNVTSGGDYALLGAFVAEEGHLTGLLGSTPLPSIVRHPDNDIDWRFVLCGATAPPSGTQNTRRLVAGSPTDWPALFAAIEGVDQATPVRDTDGDFVEWGDSISVTVTTEPGDLAVAIGQVYSGAVPSSAALVHHASVDGGRIFLLAARATGSTTTLAATLESPDYLWMAGVALRSAPTGTTQTLRPDGTVSNTDWAPVSESTLHAATADDSDSTLIRATAGEATAVLSLANPSPPFDAISGITLHVRHRITP